MEVDKKLSKLLGQGELFSPDLAEIYLSLEKPKTGNQPQIVPLNVPDGKNIYAGYRLAEGRLSLKTALQNHALLILTTDYTYIHISRNKRVVSKKDDKKIYQGSLAVAESSATIERDKPFVLALSNYPGKVTLSPETNVKEVIMYEQPSPNSRRTTSVSTPPPSNNLSTSLLRQFLK